MKSYLKNHTTICHLLCLALTASLALPLPSLAASISLASSPLATTTTSSVKPNVTFVLDNSGSMSWEHMPDDATDSGSSVTFSYGYYGLRSSQCNQVYYNPAVTYLAPVYATGTSYADASFAAALPDGYLAAGATIVSAAGDHNYTNTAVNLSSGFKASLPASYTTVAGDTLAQSAYYYTYSGAQTTSALKDYNSTTNTFYTECHDSTGGSVSAIAPVSGVGGVFTKVRLASTETTTITVSAGTSTSVSGITVNGVQLMSAASTASATNTTVATNIAARITLNGFSATAAGAVVTITGPTSAANYPPIITKAAGTGTMTFTPDVFPDTTASKLTNFANWYSYYRTRMLMMKTAAGRAFKDINQNYRVGFMAMNTNASFLNVDTFWNNTNAALGALSTQKTDWYAKLYGSSPTGSTPLRVALANAGRLYANKLTMTGITINDPIQYSCQQNFTILSTDGFWNGNGGVQLDGSSAVGNQDGGAGRPMYDGATANTTVTTTYTQNNYSASGTGCSGSNKRLKTQPRIETCAVVTTGGVAGAENCGSGWSNNGAATYTGACAASVSLPSPNPSTRVQSGSAVTTAGYTGGTSDSLADVAMYYYQTDLRTSDLSNCTGALGAGTDVCTNNVFMSSADSNVQQHMTTFTLGLGATGRMKYTSSYKNDTAATNPGSDYLAVALGSTAAPAANPAICSWQTAGTTCNWPTPGDGLIENIDDLWHAAVNGHGTYFSATDPTSLSTGLSSALAGINALQGSAAAAATSTLNPVAGNNFSYVASYTTVTWKGNLESRSINTVTGVVDETATWCVENTVAGNCPSPGTIVAETSGSSTIYNCVTPNAASCSGGVMSGTDCKVEVAVACTGTMPAKVAAATDTRTIKMAGGCRRKRSSGFYLRQS